MPGWVWYAIGFVIVVAIVTLLSVLGDRWHAKRVGADRARRDDLLVRGEQNLEAQRRARQDRAADGEEGPEPPG